MEFDNTFIVAAPIDEVWRTMLDVERVAPCLPGAQVTEKTGDDAYTFTIEVELGTMTITYQGDLHVVEQDEGAHLATMRVAAKEADGEGTADGTVYMRVLPAGEQTQADIHAEVAISGRATTLGEDMIADVSARLTNSLADNLAAMLTAPAPAPETAGGPAAPGAGEATTTNGGPSLPAVTPQPVIPASEPAIAAPDPTAAAPDPTMPALDPTAAAPEAAFAAPDPTPAAADPTVPALDPTAAAPEAAFAAPDPTDAAADPTVPAHDPTTPPPDPAASPPDLAAPAVDTGASPPYPTYAVPDPAPSQAGDSLMTVLAARMRDPRTAISVLASITAVLMALTRRRR